MNPRTLRWVADGIRTALSHVGMSVGCVQEGRPAFRLHGPDGEWFIVIVSDEMPTEEGGTHAER